jgi:hypothetical protein
LLDLKRRGLDVRPELTIADGALEASAKKIKARPVVPPARRSPKCWG